MKTHRMETERITALLSECQVGSLATVGENSFPYVTPVHFVYLNGNIYIHGLPKGQKIDNIRLNPAVSFNAYKMEGLLPDGEGNPCDTNTAYQSVIARGNAEIVCDTELKRRVLNAIVGKYTPQYSGHKLPDKMVNGTAVVEIAVAELTGKYWE